MNHPTSGTGPDTAAGTGTDVGTDAWERSGASPAWYARPMPFAAAAASATGSTFVSGTAARELADALQR